MQLPCISVPPQFEHITDPGTRLMHAQRIAGVGAKSSVPSFRQATHLNRKEINRETWGEQAVIG